VGLIPALICVQSYLNVCVICDLKLRVNYVALEYGAVEARLFPGGEVIEASIALGSEDRAVDVSSLYN
jgi:hypothetical protein